METLLPEEPCPQPEACEAYQHETKQVEKQDIVPKNLGQQCTQGDTAKEEKREKNVI